MEWRGRRIIWGTALVFVWKDWGKTLRMVGFRAEIWNQDHLNKKKSYPLDPLLLKNKESCVKFEFLMAVLSFVCYQALPPWRERHQVPPEPLYEQQRMLQNIYAWICILHINCFVTPNYFPFSISTRIDQINGSYTTVGLPMTTWLQRERSRNCTEKAFHWPAQRDQIFMELPSTKRQSFNPSSSVPLEVKRSAGMVDRRKLLTECLATVQGNANWLQRLHRPNTCANLIETYVIYCSGQN
jgi:hypothetical protein